MQEADKCSFGEAKEGESRKAAPCPKRLQAMRRPHAKHDIP